jgi:hypothetical protein
VYSWDPSAQRWLETGPGATGPGRSSDILVQAFNFKPILGNGVVHLEHFHQNGEDFIVPSSTTRDVDQVLSSDEPTTQCGVVWRYNNALPGYEKYQDCGWLTAGGRHHETFKIEDELYMLATSHVTRRYNATNLNYESYQDLPNFILKWSDRVKDSEGNLHSAGFFLTGSGQSEQPFASSDDRYNAAFGNNGNNVFQVRGGGCC